MESYGARIHLRDDLGQGKGIVGRVEVMEKFRGAPVAGMRVQIFGAT